MSSEISPSKTHRVEVDSTKCCGYGLCAALCPEVYKLDSDGIIYLESDQISDELLEAATEGAEACPAEVIVIVE
ncbi:MAG: ferredoxin [Colwellia sp.]|nr:MAG: ferredoxin [Colwellia sp.]